METIKVNLKNINNSKAAKIANYLKRGKVCVLPSDTSYALCAKADEAEITNKIYQIKKREKLKSISVFVKDILMIENIADLDNNNKKILQKYLPGTFTFILKKKEKIYDNISFDKKTIAVRLINSKLINNIFQYINFPITATSANITGQAPIYDPREILFYFQDKPTAPDLLVDGGNLREIIPSTLVDLTSNVSRILRQGKEKFQ